MQPWEHHSLAKIECKNFTPMAHSELLFENVEDIKKRIQQALSEAKTTKVELLKHYLLNYILYLNAQDQTDDSPIKEKLLKISVLLEKLVSMEKKMASVDPRRIVDEKMMKNEKNTNKKSTNPRKKFRASFDKLKERTVKYGEADLDKSKSNKFN